jgi:glutamyl-tRNA reductase
MSSIGLERITGSRVRLDIVYTATSCEDYVIDEEKLEVNGLAVGRPLMLVDIAVPRNIGTDCNNVSTNIVSSAILLRFQIHLITLFSFISSKMLSPTTLMI